MLVYESTKEEFLEDVFHDELTNNIINNFNEKVGSVNEAEVRSWDNSMQITFKVLKEREIPVDSGVAYEFRITYYSKLVDFCVIGKTKETNESVIDAELKRREKVEKIE